MKKLLNFKLSLGSMGCFFALALVSRIHASDVQKNTAPSVPLDKKTKSLGERSPGFSNLELKIERTPKGTYKVIELDPEGPYKDLVREGQEFESLEDIPRPHQ